MYDITIKSTYLLIVALMCSYCRHNDTVFAAPPKIQTANITTLTGVLKRYSHGNIPEVRLLIDDKDKEDETIQLCEKSHTKRLFSYGNFTVKLHGIMKPAGCFQLRDITFLKTPQNREAISGKLVDKTSYFVLKPLSTEDTNIYKFYTISPSMRTYLRNNQTLIISVVKDIKDNSYYKVTEIYSYPNLNLTQTSQKASPSARGTNKKPAPKPQKP